MLAELRTTTDDRQHDEPVPRSGCDPPVSGDGGAAPASPSPAGGDGPCVAPVEHDVDRLARDMAVFGDGRE
ncbi:hypothetical protein [Saccharomonospora iraqiensis]|uniref:hypothetical protein n=1 Tax=Saccharomonospora iraqiensis TaxID=52698 RepID=UPI00022DF4C1|nr:hypothetical protein [Saccharomonospora iraqiensis]